MILKQEITREIAADWLSGNFGESLYIVSSGGFPEFIVTQNKPEEYIARFECIGRANLDWSDFLGDDDEYLDDNTIIADGKKVSAYEFLLSCYENDANIFDDFVYMIEDEVDLLDCPCWDNPEYEILSEKEFRNFLEEEECGIIVLFRKDYYVKYFDLDQDAICYIIDTEKEILERL